MIDRALAPYLRERLATFPCVALLGPRQVGKSTLARTIADSTEGALFFNLALGEDRAQLADPATFLARQIGRLVVLDEISRAPDVLQALRAQVELRGREGQRAGHFLLLSSDCEWMRRNAAEHLGGHLASIELTPLQAQEIGDPPPLPELELIAQAQSPVPEVDPREEEMRLWLRGGFPPSYLADTDEHSFGWRQAFIEAVIGRGFYADGTALPIEAVRRGWQSIATHQGTEVDPNRIGHALGIVANHAVRFVDSGCDGQLLRRLPRWTTNDRKQLRLPDKLYIRDSGMLHALLGVADAGALDQHGAAGNSWEGHAIEALITAADPDARHAYFRTDDGTSEMDLVLARRKETWGIEIKKSANPALSKGFYAAREALRCDRSIVVYRGADRFQADRTVEMMALRDAAREVAGW